MRQDHRIALARRIAEHIGADLRAKHAEVPPLQRVRIAYATARAIVARAEQAGTLPMLEYRLTIMEAGDFQI